MTGRTIAHLFQELADHWRGWDGERTWTDGRPVHRGEDIRG
jgi:hypothetical protein